MKSYIFFLSFVVILAGCHQPSNSYQITVEGVFSRFNIITQFSISQFKMDLEDLNDIRPKVHKELMRYCCELKIDRMGDKKVLFKNVYSNYRWTLCKLDTSIVANDSLNSLSFKDKLNYLKERDKFRKDIPGDHMQLPFSPQRGYVYQIFGLPDLEGSYFFCLNSHNKLTVQFFDSGPW